MTRTRVKSRPKRMAGREADGARFTTAELEKIAERILKFNEAEETEVEISSPPYARTRFSNTTIHQNVAEPTLQISVRALVGGRTARAVTNKIDDESLR